MNFYITKNLRKINFWNSRSAKSAILIHLEALNCDFLLIFALSERQKMTKFANFRAYKMVKTAVFALLEATKLISRIVSDKILE